jgi:phospholipid-transporting ATPase
MNSNKDEYIEKLITNKVKDNNYDHNKNIHDPKFSSYTVSVNTKSQQYIKNDKLLTNNICTSKYNKYNAFPKIAWEQFSKSSNIYFLIMAILQLLPAISPTGGYPVMLTPLLVVVTVNGFKDFWEDYKRKISDNRENKNICKSNSKAITWEQLKVGDIIKVNKDEYFPADLIMLYSTNKSGIAYVETKNIDGETNLKYKESVNKTYNALKNVREEANDDYIANLTGLVSCDAPNANMYEYEGTYYYENRNNEPNFSKMKSGVMSELNSSNENKDLSILQESKGTLESDNAFYKNSIINLEYNNLLLRGSSLRNTEYIIGIVIYAGHHTKIMLNSLNARTKQSRVFRIMNSQLYFIILVQLIICIVFSIFFCIDNSRFQSMYNSENQWNILFEFFYSFFAWLLNTNNIVPISLLVTVEMIKYCQAMLIMWDYKIYDQLNKRNAIVQSSGLNEELGMVNHIFTDKTGTLTKNIMQFKYLVVNEYIYGSDRRNKYFNKDIKPEELEEKKVINVDYNDPKIYDHWDDPSHLNSEHIE